MKSTSKDPDSVTDSLLELKDDVTSGINHYLGVVPSMVDRREYLVFLAASLLVSLGILLFLGYIYLWPLLKPYYLFISDKEKISALLRSTGNLVPIVFILVEAVQALTIFWPMPLEMVGGYLFGLPLGILLSTLGLTLGSVMAFLVGRWLERTYLRRLVDPEKLARFHELMKRQGSLAAFIIYLIPGIPKDFASYILGSTFMSLQFFVVAVVLFRLPSTFLLCLQGAEVAQGHYWASVGVIALSYLLAFLILRYRHYVYQWIKAWHHLEE
jgi:uncharacterized membrane protein YdjX (TVP38/TMEM64 family)